MMFSDQGVIDVAVQLEAKKVVLILYWNKLDRTNPMGRLCLVVVKRSAVVRSNKPIG